VTSPSAEHTALRILDVLRGGTGLNVSGSQSLEKSLEEMLPLLTTLVAAGGGAALSDATPTTVQPGVAGTAGAGADASRDTHVHPLEGVASASGGSADSTTPLVKDRRVTLGGAVTPGTVPIDECLGVVWGRLSNGVFIGVDPAASGSTVYRYPWTGTAFGAPVAAGNGDLRANGVDRDATEANAAAAYSVAPFLHAIPWTGAAFGAAIAPSPAVTGAGAANRVRFHPDGDRIALARQHLGGTTAGIAVYPYTGAAIGAALDAISDSRNGSDCAWSPDGAFLAVTFEQTPFFEVYPWDGTSFGTPIVPAAAPAATCNAVHWSPDGDFIAVSVGDANRLWVFPWDGSALGTAVKTTGAAIPAATPEALKFSADRAFIATSFFNGAAPFAQLHSLAFDGSAIGTPVTIPVGGAAITVGRDVDISPDGAFIAIGTDGTVRLSEVTATRSLGL
jgi:hypothetical protein